MHKPSLVLFSSDQSFALSASCMGIPQINHTASALHRPHLRLSLSLHGSFSRCQCLPVDTTIKNLDVM